MKEYKNFLEKEDFLNLKDLMFGHDFPWYFCPEVVDDEKYFQFTHIFYNEHKINSSLFNFIIPILNKIKPIAILRIKANLLYRTEKIVEHGMHTDYDLYKKFSNIKTAIYYCNTNNGYTKFKDGTKVKSEENKFIEFDLNKEHTGSSCTDEQRRIVINFNYFK